jgi:hypothetical protein
MKHIKLFEGAAKRKYSDKEVNNFKKVTEFCEEYVADIMDDCKSRSIIVTSYTRPARKGYEWTLLIKSYYPVKIEQLCKRMSNEFEVINWCMESSGTSSLTSQTENKTIVTIQLDPKFELE